MFNLLRNKKGMTLIEVLVAGTILGILVAPLASFFIVSSQRARRTMSDRQALTVAEAKIESMRETNFGGYLDLENQESRTWEWDPGEAYSFGEIKTETFQEGNIEMFRVTVTVYWGERVVGISTLVSRNRP